MTSGKAKREGKKPMTSVEEHKPSATQENPSFGHSRTTGKARFSWRETRPKQRPLASSAIKIVSLLLLAFAGIFIATNLTYLIMFIALDLPTDPLWTTTYTAISYALSCILIILVPTKIKKLSLKTSRAELGLSGLPKWRDIGLAIAGFAIYFLAASLLVALFASIFPWFNATEPQQIGYSGLPNLASYILAFIALVLVAPIAEEIIFRGWLYAKLRRYAAIWISVLLVSALFAAVHGAWNVAINVFAMSLVMCLLRELTGTIYASIILHIIKNAIAFYLLIVTGVL